MARERADVASIFDAVAESYSDRVASNIDSKLRRLLLSWIATALPGGSTILDVGSGTGAYAIPLAKAGYRVTAIDISEEMIRALGATAERERVSVRSICIDAGADLERLGMQDAAICICGPVSYAADPAPVIRRILEVLPSGGRLWLAFPRAAALEQVLREPGRALRPMLSRPRPHAISRKIGSSVLTIFIHDATTLEKRLDALFSVERVFGSTLVKRGPYALDRLLGGLPILRRFGAVTVVYGRKR